MRREEGKKNGRCPGINEETERKAENSCDRDIESLALKGHQLVDNTVCPYLSNHSTDHYQIFSSCCLCQMKAKLKISVHLHMGNYVNQVHHTINTGESREVKKKNFA